MLAVELRFPVDLAADLVAFADVLAAIAVTVHVLLRQRDVRAAIGWIGLVWLSPIIGPVAYYFFGINRVARRAARLTPRTLRRTKSDAATARLLQEWRGRDSVLAIARVGDQLTANPLCCDNAISALHSGDEAYPVMLDAIRKAQRSVALASYIFRIDEVGGAFMQALCAAHQRGVKIRVLVDGVGGGYLFSPAVRALRKRGVAAGRFMHNWLPWRMTFLNMRNHKKLLIVDGATGFTGGLNLGAENLRRSRPGRSVEDVHFRVSGPVVSQLMLTFAEDWNFTTGEMLDGDAWWPELSPAGSTIARGVSTGPDEDMGKLEAVLATAVASAKRRLRIVTPYFLPDHRLMSDIGLAVLRGVDVEIILPDRSNHRLLDWATRSHLGFFAVPGVSIYLAPAPFDHSKLVTVDGLWCALGSANWDVRSLRLNFEFVLECYHEGSVADIDFLIDAKTAPARRLQLQELDARSLPVRLRDSAARLLLPYL